jgi:hypothetical protein
MESRDALKRRSAAWFYYYEAQQDFEAKYESAYRKAPVGKAPVGKDKLTFEIWLIFNVNGDTPQALPQLVSLEFGNLEDRPVNHFLRVQRSNYPDGKSMGMPAMVLPPYPSDEEAAKTILRDIFLRRPREHASLLVSIVRVAERCAQIITGIMIAAGLILLCFLAYLLFEFYATQGQQNSEKDSAEELVHQVERLEHLAGKRGQTSGDLQVAVHALDQAILDVEAKINALEADIRGLRVRLTHPQSLFIGSRGLDEAPCWEVAADPGATKRLVPYLFEIELRENDATPIRVTQTFRQFSGRTIVAPSPFAGTTIVANYSKSLGEQSSAELPLDGWISADRFRNRVAGPVNQIYASLGKANTCRHYVRLCDQNYRTKDADSYKQLLGLIEGTFYIYRPTDPGTCPIAD